MDPETPPVPTPEPAPAVPASPWAADAATYFGDNAEAVAGFDRYMREKQQPYVTQLEEGTKDAREYYNDLMNDTDTTLRSLVTQRYGDEFAAAYAALFEEDEPAVAPEPVAPAAPADEIPEWAKPLVESHQEKVDREAREAAATEYATAKTELQTAHPDLTADDLELIDPFVYGAGGDMEAAYTAYNAWREKAGVAPAAAPEPPATPPVLGGGTSATPPLATEYKTYDQIGDALKAYHQRQAASSTPPPVVG